MRCTLMILGSLLVGSLPGIILGSILVRRIPESAVRIVLGCTLLLVCARFWFLH